MSDYGDGIIERLNENSGLKNKDNPFHKLINEGVGGWLDNFEDNNLSEQIFLETASGIWLDLQGKEYNIVRKINESDDDYRERIVHESLGHLTIPFLVNVFNLILYCYIENFNVENNTLTSDNVFACHKYVSFVDEDLQNILKRKYVIGTGLTYLQMED